jgi:hypothetical protein
VLALLVPEVPAIVWIMGDPTTTHVPDDVLSAADVLLVDSTLAANAALGFQAVLGLIDNHDAVATDFSWIRTRYWRELTAQLFDGNESHLEDIREIEVVGGESTISNDALLVAGWLGSRLGLTIASATSDADLVSATFYDGTRGVRMSARPSMHGHELNRIGIRTSATEFSVELHAESDHLHVRADALLPPIHRVVAREQLDEASVLVAALEGPADAQVYRESAEAALGLFVS